MIKEELIEKYLEHKLSEDEVRVFERHLAESPEMLQSVENYKRLLLSIRHLGRAEKLNYLNSISPYPSLLERIQQLLPALILLIGLALFFYYGFNFFKNKKNNEATTSISLVPVPNTNPKKTVTSSGAVKQPESINQSIIVNVETIRTDSLLAPSTTFFTLSQDSSLTPFAYTFKKDTIRLNAIEPPVRIYLFPETESYYLQLNQRVYRFKPYTERGVLEIETDSISLKRIFYKK